VRPRGGSSPFPATEQQTEIAMTNTGVVYNEYLTQMAFEDYRFLNNDRWFV
jgi:hypothetical protein